MSCNPQRKDRTVQAPRKSSHSRSISFKEAASSENKGSHTALFDTTGTEETGTARTGTDFALKRRAMWSETIMGAVAQRPTKQDGDLCAVLPIRPTNYPTHTS